MASPVPPLPSPMFPTVKAATSKYNTRGLVKLFKSSRREKLIRALQRLNARGDLRQAVSQWSKIQGLMPQSSHRHAVDAHSLEVVRLVSARPEFPHVNKPEVLLIAALLHDIGKGLDPQNHEASGAKIIPEILRDSGLLPNDIARISWLIGNHSEMGSRVLRAASSREPNELVKAVELARIVQTPERLLDLYLLGYADTLDAFGSIQTAQNVEQLYHRVDELLRYGISPAYDIELFLQLEQTSAKAALKVCRPYCLRIALRGKQDSLWKLGFVLSQKEINITQANIFYFKTNLWSVEFSVETARRPSDDFADVIESFNAGVPDDAISDLTAPIQSPFFPNSVEVDNGLSAVNTGLIIKGNDRLFFFARIAHILSAYGRINQALVTNDHQGAGRVVDIFYITDHSGNKITDEAVLSRLKAEIARAL